MSRSRNAEKNWQNAYLTEQRQPGGHVGAGRFTSGYINPADRAAARNAAAIARNRAMQGGGKKPKPGKTPSASVNAQGIGTDPEDQHEAAEAKALMEQAADVEHQIDNLQRQLKGAKSNLAAAQQAASAGYAAGASATGAASNTAAAARQAASGAAAGAQAGGAAAGTPAATQSVAAAQGRVNDLKGDIKQLKAQRKSLLSRARALLRDARKGAVPMVVKSEQRDDLSERILAALASGDRVRLGAGELRDLLG